MSGGFEMKLTEDNIQVKEGFIVIPNRLVFEEAKKIKQQILKNQKIVERIREGNKLWQLAEIEDILK